MSSSLGLLAAFTLAAPVQLELAPSCSELDVAEARRVFAMELRAGAPSADGRWATRVLADCDGLQVRLRVDDPVTRKALERAVDLAPVTEPIRARTLGLAAAELVVLSWSELVLQLAPTVEPAAPPPPADTRDEAAAVARARLGAPSRGRLLLQGTLHAALGGAPALWGLGLRWSWERLRVLGFELDLRFDYGRASFAPGEVVAARGVLGLSVHARADLGWLSLRALAGPRGGAALLSGVPALGSSARGGAGVGPWLGVAAGGAVALRASSFALEVGAEGGVPVVGVVGLVGGAEAVRLNGFWLGAHVGVGFEP